MGTWGAASFDNDTATEWFYAVEESDDPGAVIAETLDRAVSTAERLEIDLSSQAVAAAELCAACAGELPARLPEQIERWVASHPHHSTSDEVAHATQAIARVVAESELGDLWAQAAELEGVNEWRPEIEDLLDRLQRCGMESHE